MSLRDCRVVEFPRINDARGNLSFIESRKHLPFAIERVYYLYDVPGGETRGGHGHRKLEQMFIAMSGSFDLVLDDGFERKTFSLNRSYRGVYVSSMIWRELENFSSGSVCLVLASHRYEEADYIRDYNEFLQEARRGPST
jgi:hypothetical protein